jgi:hypothetical protein
MTPLQIDYEHKAAAIISHLEKRRMGGTYFPTAKEAVDFLNEQIAAGTCVSFGGSMTLSETGILELLRSRSDITLLDRDNVSSSEEKEELFRKSFYADTYLMSTNAITMDGQLVNIDGTGNRVSALIFGPKKVFLVTGMNKVTRTLDEALDRVHQIASPPNCIRLNRDTPCAKTGACANCLSEDCICNQTVITRRSGIAGRIHVILIGESYGY